MTIDSVGGTAQSYLSQFYSTQQAQAASAVSVDSPLDAGGAADTSAAGASASNSLTGTATSPLDSQTLQALMDLTQQTDPSQQSGQTGQAHRHHHHHGGGAAPPSTDTSSASATTASASASDPAAIMSTDAEDADASLESALLMA